MKKFYLLIFSLFITNINAQVDWCNLQWPENGTIEDGGSFTVYAQVYKAGVTDAAGQGTSISAWIGINSSDTDPATWSSSAWKAASYNTDNGNNDEYMADIASGLSAGTYYYASRFENNGSYNYGGYNSGGGGFWDGTTNVSGILTINPPKIDWANLQWPASATILEGSSVEIFARVFEDGVTNGVGAGANIDAWIGVNDSDTDPATWSNSAWNTASFIADYVNNDEYKSEIGYSLAPGTYYYASRFQLDGGDYYYGGYNTGGGGAWDGTSNVSGVLTINSNVVDSTIDWANLQWPPDTTIIEGESFTIYAQVYDDSVTNESGKGGNISAWIGINSADTDPSTWNQSVWEPATFTNDVGNNDEYTLDAGASLSAGKYYYASRFQLNDGDYYYGGYNAGGGGAWDDTNNVSGVLTVLAGGSGVNWCTMVSPSTFLMRNYYSFDITAKVYKAGVTEEEGKGDSIKVWFGYGINNNDPSKWGENNWHYMTYKNDSGNDDVFGGTLNIGPKSSYTILADSFYYAIRTQYESGPYTYGGYSSGGGGIWDGTTNVSGIAYIELDYNNLIRWANIVGPSNITIDEGDSVEIFAQGWQWNITDHEGVANPIYSWIGVNDENTDPATWDESSWIKASYVQDVGNTDAFSTFIGSNLTAGTYYFASRFSLDNIKYNYGAYNEDGGGTWDGVKYVNGVLNIQNVSDVNNDDIPNDFILYQNYPNPFNPTTNIRFGVPQSSNVKLTIYNLVGEIVAELTNKKYAPGNYTINWNAENFASGIYILQLNSISNQTGNNYRISNKMLLLK